jgi:hypothetical protein
LSPAQEWIEVHAQRVLSTLRRHNPARSRSERLKTRWRRGATK